MPPNDESPPVAPVALVEELPPGRRRFLCAAAGAGAAVLGLSLAAGPLVVTLAPAFSEDVNTGELWMRIGPAARFEVKCPPTRVVLRRDERDAWLTRERVALGVIYVQRPAADRFIVHSGLCPHLGCGVSWGGESFVCPCHGAAFSPDGALAATANGDANPAKRGLDALESRLVDGGATLEVRWQRFRLDVAEKEAVG